MRRALAALATGVLATLVSMPASYAASPDTVILVIDASSSMSGRNLTSVITAAQAQIDDIPAGARVGLVTFNSNQVTSLPPTADMVTVRAALDAVEARGGTRLYDGIIKAIQGTPSPTSTRLVVVTDGYDRSSDADAPAVLAAIERSGVAIDIVTVGATDRNLATMKTFTDAGNGRVFQSANATALAEAFTRALQEAAPVPPAPPASPSASPSSSASVIPTEDPGPPSLREIVFGPYGQAVAVAIVVFIYSYLLVHVIADRRRKRSMDKAIATYDPVTAGLRMATPDTQASAFIEVPAKGKRKKARRERPIAALRSRSFPKLAERIERADLTVSPQQFLGALVAGGFVLTALLQVFIAFAPLSVVLATFLIYFGQRSYLKSRAVRYRRGFEGDLADFLVLIASGLRSGMSFSQSVDSAVSEGTGPVERQVRRALAEVRVGSTLDEALIRVANRMESDDLKWAIAAVQIQREVGGNLSKILDTAAATIRARAELKREIRTLSAEGRLSAYVLLALPIGLFLFLVATNREYIQLLWTETIGWLLLGAFVVSVSLGYLWLRKIVAVVV